MWNFMNLPEVVKLFQGMIMKENGSVRLVNCLFQNPNMVYQLYIDMKLQISNVFLAALFRHTPSFHTDLNKLIFD